MSEVVALHGAIQIDRDDPDVIAAGTSTLLHEVQDRNELCWDDVVGLVFTMTPDLTSGFPAAATLAGTLGAGLVDVPMLCGVDIDAPLPRVVQLLAHVRTERPRSGVADVYLRGAAALHPGPAA